MTKVIKYVFLGHIFIRFSLLGVEAMESKTFCIWWWWHRLKVTQYMCLVTKELNFTSHRLKVMLAETV